MNSQILVEVVHYVFTGVKNREEHRVPFQLVDIHVLLSVLIIVQKHIFSYQVKPLAISIFRPHVKVFTLMAK